MSPKAQQTHLEFVRLAAEEPSSLYFEKFLQHGSSAWPRPYRQRFPALANWQGIGSLKKQLALVAGYRGSSQVLIASRSAQLMMLGARLLSRGCRKVLTTDFSWPAYENTLRHTLTRDGNRFHVVRLRDAVLREQMTAGQLVESLLREFVANECDGIFLPAVDNLGTRLPVGDVVRSIRRQTELRFVVIDAAQAFAHVPLDDCLTVSDFTIAGCHKWLRGYFPLGLAFYGRPASRDFVELTATQMLQSHEIDDPLLRFCGQLSGGSLDGYSETVNLGPLFSCCGAVADAVNTSLSLNDGLLQQSANAKHVTDITCETDWQPVRPHQELRTGILLLENRHRSTEATTGDDLRMAFQQHGVIVTGYDGGLVRLSMPKRPLSRPEIQQLHRMFRSRHTNGTACPPVAAGQAVAATNSQTLLPSTPAGQVSHLAMGNWNRNAHGV